ncbi:MAG: Crp/Fnr family transcriptional regulator [Candidatus Devosia phytovorans]|uniref:Crp/Fnr family transcriptional regulator n=1 Tax=Candidatus Devosia phytovorans TaxID=3121372 RepID=A0AAJ5VZ32_9HYPH|nr:Crp/Fnr family transcriptional regulator [Devosia sp.]WEK06661.1 MAG: Crp/Fnr family transcriptional regulator [Devosia sp.]
MSGDLQYEDEPRSCRQCSVRHHGICGALNGQQLTLLSRNTRHSRHEPGAELFGDETEITSYANVISGVIKLMKVLEDGRQQVVGLKFANDFIGRIHARSNAMSAEAASEVELCLVPRQIIETLLEDSRQLERHLMKEALRELDEAREWMVTLGRKSAAERVASFLYLIALHQNPDLGPAQNAIEYDLPLTRSDMADFLGLSIETVSRQLTELRRLEVVVIRNKRHVIIPDTGRLRRRSG